MTTIPTQYGPIHYQNRFCKDDYANMQLFNQGGGVVIKLQDPALESFRACSKKLGFAILVTGTWRSCAYQSELNANDPTGRYADPRVTAHCKGLAIDVSQAQRTTILAKIHTALLAHGWHQVRSDEPWHYSYGVTV
jgi:LAS superfamily LD-carboxypeptidase LdcB